MISIRNECKDPRFNLALEEYVFYNFDTSNEYVILWQNEPSVIIGRNQNTIEEINSKFIKENNINVVRRMSGGGAVYHDLGNLNYTFIVNSDQDVISNFKRFTQPVVSTLAKLGVKAEFSGRNDITIEGKKFSGNAQHYAKDGCSTTEPYCSTPIYALYRKPSTLKSINCNPRVLSRYEAG